MKILVLGASGLAGAAIMGALQAAGHDLSGTSRAGLDRGKNPGLLQFSLEEPRSVTPLLEEIRPDAVVSCLRGDFDRQLEAHRLAAEFLCRNGGTLVYLSTANVFDGDLSRPHYEGDALCSDSAYGQFKIACEQLLQERLGKNCVILRPPEIWGRDCPRLRALVRSVQEGRPIQTYENLFVNYTTDMQIAQWVAFILDHGLRGVFHVGTRDTSDYTGFLDRLSTLLGLPRPAYMVERNRVPAYQAVLPGRGELPEHLHLSVEGVLRSLSQLEKSGPAIN